MDLFLDYLYGAAAYAHHHYSGMHGAEVERKRFSGSPCMIHLDAVKVIDGNIRSGDRVKVDLEDDSLKFSVS